jgi:putative ABC transport system permease protein
MRPTDLLKMAAANLRRNRARSVLTLVGVMIGAAALVALLSYGSGVQRAVRGEFDALRLYNTLRVTSSPSALGKLGGLAFRPDSARGDSAAEATVPLTDSLLTEIDRLDGVMAAYPEIGFPVQIARSTAAATSGDSATSGAQAVVANAEAIPMRFRRLKAYRPAHGAFFDSTDARALLVSPSMARRLGYDGAPADIVGDTLTVTTATLDFSGIGAATAMLQRGLSALPIDEREVPMRVAGLLSSEDTALSGFSRVLLPLGRAKQMPKISFFSTLDLLLNRGASEQGYRAARIQLAGAGRHAAVRSAVEEMGVYTTSFREQFDRLERLFLITDLALTVVGLIALLVATVGIANTTAMNVRERFSEIGVMKAVGGAEGDLTRLFVLEGGLLGLLGGLAGLALGWLVTLGLDALVGYFLVQRGLPAISVFHTPAWTALGILAVTLAVSLAAAFFPARRAARVEPLEALSSV